MNPPQNPSCKFLFYLRNKNVTRHPEALTRNLTRVWLPAKTCNANEFFIVTDFERMAAPVAAAEAPCHEVQGSNLC